jgi:hypothetical protein
MRGLSDKYDPDRTTRLTAFASLEGDLVRWLRDTKMTYRLWTEIAPWVHDRTRPPQDRLRRADDKSTVQDLVGLSRFLLTYVADLPADDARRVPGLIELQRAIQELERSRRPPDSGARADALNAIGFEKTIEFKDRLNDFLKKNFDENSRLQIRSCFEGLPPLDSCPLPTTATLTKIVKLFQSQPKADLPRVLLDGYLPPNALRVVTVRGAAASNPEGRDWVAPPVDEPGQDAQWATYRIPARTLANSDVSVVLLDLRSDGHTAWNRHPGFEMVIPISGTVRIEFDQNGVASKSKDAGPHSMVVYRSSISHRVVECGEDEAEARVLVIRFNIRDVPGPEGPAKTARPSPS